MMTQAEETEVLSLLRAVSSSEPATITPVKTARGMLTSWRDIFAGDVEFQVRGWSIVVFNDCNSWDYLERVTAPDGRSWEYEEMTAAVRDWQPENDAGWSPGCVEPRRSYDAIVADGEAILESLRRRLR